MNMDDIEKNGVFVCNISNNITLQVTVLFILFLCCLCFSFFVFRFFFVTALLRKTKNFLSRGFVYA